MSISELSNQLGAFLVWVLNNPSTAAIWSAAAVGVLVVALVSGHLVAQERERRREAADQAGDVVE